VGQVGEHLVGVAGACLVVEIGVLAESGAQKFTVGVGHGATLPVKPGEVGVVEYGGMTFGSCGGTPARLPPPAGLSGRAVGDLCFEVGDASVQEPVVGACRGQFHRLVTAKFDLTEAYPLERGELR
jgi:hypothetical protein